MAQIKEEQKFLFKKKNFLENKQDVLISAKKVKENSYKTDDYELYITNILHELQSPEVQDLESTEIMRKTCNLAFNVLDSIKEKKSKLSNTTNKDKIIQEINEQYNLLIQLKKSLDNQKKLQEIEKQTKKQNKNTVKIKHSRFFEKIMMQLISLTKVAAHLLSAETDKQKDIKNKEKNDLDEKQKIKTYEIKDSLQNEQISNTQLKDPSLLLTAAERKVNSSSLSSIMNTESIDDDSESKPTNKIDKKYQQGKGNTMKYLSFIIPLDFIKPPKLERMTITETINFMLINKNDILSPNELASQDNTSNISSTSSTDSTNTTVSSSNSSKNSTSDFNKSSTTDTTTTSTNSNINSNEELEDKTEKSTREKEKEKLKQELDLERLNAENILIAEVNGNRYVVYKKSKKDGRCEQVEDGILNDYKLTNGEYILYPYQDSQKTLKIEELKQPYMQFNVKEGEILKIGEFSTKDLVINNDEKQQEIQKAEQINDKINSTKKMVELTDKNMPGRKYTR